MTAPLTEADVRRIVREEIAGQWIAVDGRQVVAGLLAGAGGSAVDLPFEAGDGIDESGERLLDALVDAKAARAEVNARDLNNDPDVIEALKVAIDGLEAAANNESWAAAYALRQIHDVLIIDDAERRR